MTDTDVTSTALETLLEAKFTHLENVVMLRNGTVQKRLDKHSQRLAGQDKRIDNQKILLIILIVLDLANLGPVLELLKGALL